MANAEKKTLAPEHRGDLLAGLERIQDALLRVRHGDASPADRRIASRVHAVLAGAI